MYKTEQVKIHSRKLKCKQKMEEEKWRNLFEVILSYSVCQFA